MEITNMVNLNAEQLRQAAAILTKAIPLGWATFEDAADEITECLIPENTLLAAVEGGDVLGWGGILPQYDGNVFELHPLAVRWDMRGKGVGAALLAALEGAARERGGLTMCIGADDEKEGGETSLANADLYDNLSERIVNFRAGTHQSAFYMKNGYKIIGVMPDANGAGKPDIFLGKRL